MSRAYALVLASLCTLSLAAHNCMQQAELIEHRGHLAELERRLAELERRWTSARR